MNNYIKTQIDLVAALLIHNELSTGITDIEFYKADDSVRAMRATTDPALLPESEREFKASAYDLQLVKVFDVEKQAWRSFKIDRLKSIKGQDCKQFLLQKFEEGI